MYAADLHSSTDVYTCIINFCLLKLIRSVIFWDLNL